MVRSLEALIGWIEERPAWLRPALYGALLVPAWAYKKGALLIVPLAIIGVLATGEHPLRTLGLGLLVFGSAVAGAALSGLAYSFVGRHVQPTPVIGPYLAGWLSAWPYALVALLILRLREGTPLAAWLNKAEVLPLGLAILYIGAIVGFVFFRDDY